MNTLTAAELKRRRMTAVQWLLSQRTTGTRRKTQIDRALREERKNWT